LVKKPVRARLGVVRGSVEETAAARPGSDVASMFENCIGCKWTLHVLDQIRRGVRRPGALERSKRGLTAKVLNERLVKLTSYGVLTKRSFAEIPPRVEYWLTPFGERFVALLDQIEALRREFS
jgi:DNA-binding HxlR family transcriptional regulator